MSCPHKNQVTRHDRKWGLWQQVFQGQILLDKTRVGCHQISGMSDLLESETVVVHQLFRGRRLLLICLDSTCGIVVTEIRTNLSSWEIYER